MKFGNLNDSETRRLLRRSAALLPKRDPLIVNGRQVENLQYCHELVRDTAMQLAGAIYDSAMRINENHDAWKALCPDMDSDAREREWITLMWPRLLDDARATLARMLGGPLDEGLKKRIHEAIVLDGYLRKRGRGPKPLFRV